MPWMELLRAVLALGFVAGLIYLCAYLFKRTTFARQMMPAEAGKHKRLNVVDKLTIDPRHRLVLIRHDKTEHLILLGATAPLLISSVTQVEDA